MGQNEVLQWAADADRERVIALEGGVNFRDLGGYRTASGGRVRWGRVYRSAALHRLTPADVTTVDQLGLRVVYDLRTDRELELAPSILPDGVRVERLPIDGKAAKITDLTDLIVAGKLADVSPDFLERTYEAMAEASASTFGHLLTRLAQADGTPALFHCAAGKDRTGMSAVLLLSALGVDEATILDDYELSSVHFTDRQMAKLRLKLADVGMDLERYNAVFGVSRDAMATMLAALRERYGSVERYLREECGVGDDIVAALRARLVQSPG
ncbi:MAG: tyrosine-protein phosphatase [Frankia sp.]